MRGGAGQPPELDVSMPRSQTNLSGSERFHSGTDRIKSAALRRASVKAESSREHSVKMKMQLGAGVSLLVLALLLSVGHVKGALTLTMSACL